MVIAALVASSCLPVTHTFGIPPGGLALLPRARACLPFACSRSEGSLYRTRGGIGRALRASEEVREKGKGGLGEAVRQELQRGGGYFLHLKREMLSPKPETRNPKPETQNPKPGTRNPKPEIPDPRPETRNPKFETRDPTPEIRNPRPGARWPFLLEGVAQDVAMSADFTQVNPTL